MALNDLPAVVDYIRETTKNDKISCFSHSQGSSQLFIALSADPDFWKSRINLLIAVPPIVVSDDKSFFVTGGERIYPALESSLSNFGVYEMFGQNWDNAIKVVKVFVPKLENQLASQYLVSDLNNPVRA
jgi:hypothetical protein